MARGSLRDSIRAIGPKWLQSGVGEKLLYSFGLALDALTEKLNQGMRMHIPTYGDSTALPYLSRDRQIIQGPNESPNAFAQRLKRAYDDWARAGGDWAVLRQVLGFLTPSTPQVEIVNAKSGVVSGSGWRVYPAGFSTASPPWFALPFAAWNWDSLGGQYNAGWWRFWLVVFSVAPNDWAHAGKNWGDASLAWGDTNRSWGLDVPATTIAGLRSVVALWKGAHAWCRWIVVSLNSARLQPGNAADGTNNPDGSWGYWHKTITNASGVTVAVASRPADCRYCDGVLNAQLN